MPFEPGNEFAKKDESELSQHPSAVRARAKRAAEAAASVKREAEAAAKAAAAKDAKRVAMVQEFGEARVRAWESLRVAGVIVQDLLSYFFWDGQTVTTDETVEEVIDALARALEGCEPDPEMPETEWDRFREDVDEARRLGFDIDVTPANAREFFGYYLRVRRGEIVRDDSRPRPWWPERPVSVQAILEPPEPKPEGYATAPPPPPVPRPTIPAQLHDVLTQLQALQK